MDAGQTENQHIAQKLVRLLNVRIKKALNSVEFATSSHAFIYVIFSRKCPTGLKL
jgi:hypothetical protein